MTTVHIFDIDTTIANNTHRAELLTRTCVVCLAPKGSAHRAPCPTCHKETASRTAQEDWDTFFDPALVIKDTVQPKSLLYANKLRARRANVHFLTGRSEPLREVTELWLTTKFNKQDGEELIMRPEVEDGLLASQFKERALHRLSVASGYGPDTMFFFYEDDPHVLGMYGKHGIVVQCPEAWEYLVPDQAVAAEMPFATL
jgi:hypothetical protein